MNIIQKNNVLTLEIKENFGSMLAYLYLLTLDFISCGLFVPSLNPPQDNDYMPNISFFTKEHKLSYKKNAVFSAKENTVTIVFDTIDDANSFKEDLEHTW